MPILKEDYLLTSLDNRCGIVLVIDFVHNEEAKPACEVLIRSTDGDEIIGRTRDYTFDTNWDEIESWQQFYSEYLNEKDKSEFNLNWDSRFLEFIFEVKYPVASLYNVVVKVYFNCAKILNSYKWPGKGPICVEMLARKTELDIFIEELNQQLLKLA
jgi:hypothetical protein